MPMYQTGGYRVKPSAVEKVKEAIQVFVKYVQENEPGTKMYLAWQEKNDPTRFNHLFIFENETNLEIDAQNAQCEETVIDMLHSISWVGQVCVISVLAETQPACGIQT